MNALVVSSNGLAMLFEHRELVLKCRLIGDHITDITISCHQLERHLLTASADHQRNMWLLYSFGLIDRAPNLVIGSFKGGLLLGPHSQNDLHRFLQLAQTLWPIRKRVAIGSIIGLVPACSDAKGESPMREDIEGRSHFCL